MTHAAVMTNALPEEEWAAEVVNIELGQICFYRRASLEHGEHSGRGGQESSGEVRAVSITSFPRRKTIRVSWNRRRISFQGILHLLLARKLRSFLRLSQPFLIRPPAHTNRRGNKITNGTNRARSWSPENFSTVPLQQRDSGIGRMQCIVNQKFLT